MKSVARVWYDSDSDVLVAAEEGRGRAGPLRHAAHRPQCSSANITSPATATPSRLRPAPAARRHASPRPANTSSAVAGKAGAVSGSIASPTEPRSECLIRAQLSAAWRTPVGSISSLGSRLTSVRTESTLYSSRKITRRRSFSIAGAMSRLERAGRNSVPQLLSLRGSARSTRPPISSLRASRDLRRSSSWRPSSIHI